MTEYRASFDATIKFSNGGDLTAHGFRVDIPSPDIDEDGIAALFVASLGLLMTDLVTVTNVEIFTEPHKGTRGGAVEFAIDRLTLLGNTGRYLDAPYHRYPDGADLSGIPAAAWWYATAPISRRRC